MWTIYGYAHDFIKRHINDEIFDPHRDKLALSLVTVGARKDSNAGLMNVIISCPVKAELHSYVLDVLLVKLSRELGLPPRQWNVYESDIEGCILLGLRFGEKEDE